MTVKEITFKCTKANSYYTIGSIRIYDSYHNVYPIKFTTKNNTTLNTFYIQGTNITGTVSTKNSWGTYYFVDSPFDTDKSIVTSYPSMNYWLSSSADTIIISFDRPIKISKIDFIPYCADGANRKQNAIEITALNANNEILLKENHNTSTYLVNQIYTVLTPQLSYFNMMLLKSNNTIYSIDSANKFYETNMTGIITPSPLVASATTSTWSPHKAFDGITDSVGWLGKGTTGWIHIDFGSIKEANRVEIYAGGFDIQTAPKDFEILGSNDGVNFKNILSVENKTDWVAYVGQEFTFERCSYRYYRINTTRNNGGSNYVDIDEIIFGLKHIEINVLPSYSKANFINYGKNQLTAINQTITVKNYILQGDSISINEQGLWTKKVDKKPLSISFESC
ncbi:discoidin domain-containing protein [Lysinibacillus sphaericus]|uniref:discoidin domain-containing protein n=1 Tax=Lysinibacillus sphaericus TaxID=1421 RepID=UPI0037FC1274